MIRLPRFAGLEQNRSQTDRELFVRTIAGAGYDPVGVAAVIELETGGKWDPKIRGIVAFTTPPGYAVGLLQFAPSTAASLGTSTLELERMTFAEQLPFVPAYYRKFGPPSMFTRPGDYYLAGWGARPNIADGTILAESGKVAYDKNQGLDYDDDGRITAAELRGWIDRKIASASSRGFWEFPMDPSMTVRVQDPQGTPLGTATVSDAVSPGSMALASQMGVPTMIAYPNGLRFLQYAPGVILPVVTNHPYTPLTEPVFGLEHAAVILGLACLAATIFYGTLQTTTKRRQSARAA